MDRRNELLACNVAYMSPLIDYENGLERVILDYFLSKPYISDDKDQFSAMLQEVLDKSEAQSVCDQMSKLINPKTPSLLLSHYSRARLYGIINSFIEALGSCKEDKETTLEFIDNARSGIHLIARKGMDIYEMIKEVYAKGVEDGKASN